MNKYTVVLVISSVILAAGATVAIKSTDHKPTLPDALIMQYLQDHSAVLENEKRLDQVLRPAEARSGQAIVAACNGWPVGTDQTGKLACLDKPTKGK